jgi:hypothetical protein
MASTDQRQTHCLYSPFPSSRIDMMLGPGKKLALTEPECLRGFEIDDQFILGLGPRQSRRRLQQGFATSEMGFNVNLRCKNPEPPMSQMGPNCDLAACQRRVCLSPERRRDTPLSKAGRIGSSITSQKSGYRSLCRGARLRRRHGFLDCWLRRLQIFDLWRALIRCKRSERLPGS